MRRRKVRFSIPKKTACRCDESAESSSDNSSESSSDSCNRLPGQWSDQAPLLTARERFAANSGPDQNATGTAQGVDYDPRVYACGGLDRNGNLLFSCEKYDPNTNRWTSIAPLPTPLADCGGSFVPDYAPGSSARTLGYVYIAGGRTPREKRSRTFLRYNIKMDIWETLDPLPEAVAQASLQYLDDVGGPLAQLLIVLFGVQFPACSDVQTLWLVGGKGTERKTWFQLFDIRGEPAGPWQRGPNLPLLRSKPLIGRTFWRDTGITSFGVSNCASIIVAGGKDESGRVRREVQLLARNITTSEWFWISVGNNPTSIPDETLFLAAPVAVGAFGTEQWPETLVTGARPILFGGKPEANAPFPKRGPSSSGNGSVQFAQFRFFEGRLGRASTSSGSRRTKGVLGRFPPDSGPETESDWDLAESMPGVRIYFEVAPLAQGQAGRRVSRFLCVGGRDRDGVTDRVQLFELPVPPRFPVQI